MKVTRAARGRRGRARWRPSRRSRGCAALPFEDLGFARVDLHRALRAGAPEAVFCPGKTPEQVVAIVAPARRARTTTCSPRAPSADGGGRASRPRACRAGYHAAARLVVVRPEARGGRRAHRGRGRRHRRPAGGRGGRARRRGPRQPRRARQRLRRGRACTGCSPHRDRLAEANAIVAVAGMEGALPSVIGGLVDRPVIAVPTSVGYGASFDGLAALLAMLNSCAPGVSVVNIDNGYGAAAPGQPDQPPRLQDPLSPRAPRLLRLSERGLRRHDSRRARGRGRRLRGAARGARRASRCRAGPLERARGDAGRASGPPRSTSTSTAAAHAARATAASRDIARHPARRAALGAGRSGAGAIAHLHAPGRGGGAGCTAPRRERRALPRRGRGGRHRRRHGRVRRPPRCSASTRVHVLARCPSAAASWTGPHGRMPVPAPGTAELLRGFPVVDTGVRARAGHARPGPPSSPRWPRRRAAMPPMTVARGRLRRGHHGLPETPNVLRLLRG